MARFSTVLVITSGIIAIGAGVMIFARDPDALSPYRDINAPAFCAPGLTIGRASCRSIPEANRR